MDYKQLIRDLPDYPQKGVIFRDISTLWKDKKAFKSSVNELLATIKHLKVDKVVGIESRGFVMGAVVAYAMDTGFVLVRKKEKLPWEVYTEKYELEYGWDHVEIHQDAIDVGERVLIVDDLLATGGTTIATMNLLKNFPEIEIVGAAFLVELTFLNARDKLDIPVFSVIQY